MVNIPFIQFPAYTEQLILDDESFIFQFIWNTRGEFWTLSILDPDLTPILTGLKLVLNFEHFAPYKHLAIPPGELYVFDLDPNNKTKIGFEDFTNARALQLIYALEGELVSI